MRPALFFLPPSLSLPGRVAISGGAGSVLIDLYLTRLFSSFAPAAGDPPASVHIRCWTSHFSSVSLGLLRFFLSALAARGPFVERKSASARADAVPSRPVPSPSCYGPRPHPRPRPFALVSPPVLVVPCRRCIIAISRDVHSRLSSSLFLSSSVVPRRAVPSAWRRRAGGQAGGQAHGTVEYT